MTDREEDYYVPTIEEFHVGFEFEVLIENSWVRFVCDKYFCLTNIFTDYSESFSVYEKIKNNKCRVKYLDREDIESLGFELDQCTKDGCVFYKGNLMTKEEWCLTFGGKTNPKNYLSITSMKNNPNSFTGVVKNKSELKRILKQLGIL